MPEVLNSCSGNDLTNEWVCAAMILQAVFLENIGRSAEISLITALRSDLVLHCRVEIEKRIDLELELTEAPEFCF